MKPRLFVDMDNTIVNSTRAFCSVYNETYKLHPDFTPANWKFVDRYDFKDECRLVNNVEEIFKSRLFFDNLDFINEDTLEILKELNEEFQIIIVSIGTYGNISLKTLWIDQYLSFIKDSIFIINDGCKMDKSIIDMSGGIFIEDVESNLVSSNADFKLCFGTIHEWNRNWKGNHCINWLDAKCKIRDYINNK